ncbi:MAG: ABC transporter ATP-binding protein [Rhodospirillaceae bacterium]
MTETAIDVHGLVKHFGTKTAVDGVDLQMPKGQVWGFLGPNGSGKTTTIRMICGLLKPSSGTGQCLGLDILKDAPLIRRMTGYMTQKFSFWTDLTIRENLEFVARLYHLPHLKTQVDETIETLGLTKRQTQLAGELSGGWKQRLALAAVTMHHPQLLLLDEPTAGVDPKARREFWDEIHHLSNAGVTVLVSTHYMDEAERCDRIVYLANGKILIQGRVDAIIERSGLVTLRCASDGARELTDAMLKQPGVAHAAYMESALHVSGTDRALLDKATATVGDPGLVWEPVRPKLEDVFIELMTQAGADVRSHA